MINIDKYKNIHCIGIGGIGMSAIAKILLSNGFNITGSDMNESEKVKELMADGIKVFIGHDAKNIKDADLIVYTAAVGMANPEMAEATKIGTPLVSRAEMLGCLMEKCDNSIAVSGTHGKTTTTSMLSLILQDAKLDPTLLVGGNLKEINGNVRVGGNKYFVTEACEYKDSFLELRPKIEIILNIDSDHLDYFKDINHIVRSFRSFTELVPKNGTILAYNANAFVNKAVRDMDNVITFGLSLECDYAAMNIDFDNGGMPTYDLYHKGEKLTEIVLNVPGEYNILNSIAAIACAHLMGVDVSVAKETLAKYTGTERRFDIQGTFKNNILVVDDYAHHPTEIKATLDAAKNMERNNLWCLFQPHTYTRTMALFDEFASSFEDADKIILTEIYAAREKNIEKISSRSLVPEIKKKFPDKEVHFFEKFGDIARFVYDNADENDLVITMGAGDIYKVGEMLIERELKNESQNS